QRRRARSGARARTAVVSSSPPREDVPVPSETDQMGVFIAEPELGRRETDMSTLRSIVRRLPFESAILHVVLVLCRLGSRLNDPRRKWELAKAVLRPPARAARGLRADSDVPSSPDDLLSTAADAAHAATD